MRREVIFKEKKKNKAGGAFALVGLLIGLACWIPALYGEFLSLDFLFENFGFLGTEVIFIALVFLAHITSIIIHEAGHLVFGLLSGYGFCSFRIFSFIFMKTDEGIKLKRYSIPGTAGQCLLTPPELKDGKMPTALYNIGGSLLGFAAFAIFAFGKSIVEAYPIINIFFVLSAAANLSAALTNAIPLRTAMINNDGMNAISLGKNPDAIKALRMQLLCNAESSRGVSIADMPEEWFVMPKDDKLGDALVSSCAYFCAARCFARGEYDKAKEIIEHLFEVDASVIGVHRAHMILDLGFIAAINGDVKEAHRIFKREYPEFSRSLRNNLCALRSRYAYELLIKRSEKGAKRILILMNMLSRKLNNYAFVQELEHEARLIEYVDSLYAARIKNA